MSDGNSARQTTCQVVALGLNGKRRCLVAGEAIPNDGMPSDRCWIVVSGVIEKATVDRGGIRRILGFHFPGEICGLVPAGENRSLYELVAAIDAVVTQVTKAVLGRHHTVDFVGSALVESVISEANAAYRWTANLGRNGNQRVARFLQEMFSRLEAAGMPQEMFGTQTTIAQAVGLSLVHVNRSIKHLEANRCISRRGRLICVGDPMLLAVAAGDLIEPIKRVFWLIEAD